MSASTSRSNRSNRSSSSVRTRVTIFNSKSYIPELRLTDDSPGPAKYSQIISAITGPSFSFGHESRLNYQRFLKEKTPEHYYYPKQDRTPCFVMGRISNSAKSTSYTPAPTHYSPELAFNSTRPSVPICKFSKAERFAKYISVF